MRAGISILYILPGLKSIRQQWYIYISAVIRVNIITWMGFLKWQLNIKIRKRIRFFSTHLLLFVGAFFERPETHKQWIDNLRLSYCYLFPWMFYSCAVCSVVLCTIVSNSSPAQANSIQSESRSSEKEIDYFD
jgi:hypothetical protein